MSSLSVVYVCVVLATLYCLWSFYRTLSRTHYCPWLVMLKLVKVVLCVLLSEVYCGQIRAGSYHFNFCNIPKKFHTRVADVLVQLLNLYDLIFLSMNAEDDVGVLLTAFSERSDYAVDYNDEDTIPDHFLIFKRDLIVLTGCYDLPLSPDGDDDRVCTVNPKSEEENWSFSVIGMNIPYHAFLLSRRISNVIDLIGNFMLRNAFHPVLLMGNIDPNGRIPIHGKFPLVEGGYTKFGDNNIKTRCEEGKIPQDLIVCYGDMREAVAADSWLSLERLSFPDFDRRMRCPTFVLIDTRTLQDLHFKRLLKLDETKNSNRERSFMGASAIQEFPPNLFAFSLGISHGSPHLYQSSVPPRGMSGVFSSSGYNVFDHDQQRIRMLASSSSVYEQGNMYSHDTVQSDIPHSGRVEGMTDQQQWHYSDLPHQHQRPSEQPWFSPGGLAYEQRSICYHGHPENGPHLSPNYNQSPANQPPRSWQPIYYHDPANIPPFSLQPNYNYNSADPFPAPFQPSFANDGTNAVNNQ